MPLGNSKEGRVAAEASKSGSEIMENARKNALRKKFVHLDKIPGYETAAISVGDEPYLLYMDGNYKFCYTKGELKVRDENELKELLELYTKEKTI